MTESLLIIAGVLALCGSACERWLVVPSNFLPLYTSLSALVLWLFV